MQTTLYYYTGTGNSLWVARQLKSFLKSKSKIYSMRNTPENTEGNADAIGFIFPVHIWGIPFSVINFINGIKKDNSRYYFAIAVHAGQVSRTLIQLKHLLAGHGLTLRSGFEIKMPSNYIPWGGPGPVEEQERRYALAIDKIEEIARSVDDKSGAGIERGPLWQRIFLTLLYRLTFGMVPKMDKDFRTDEKCSRCGICVKICPSKNIQLIGDKPAWNHKCEQCLACIQWCPAQAIQYGKKTQDYERYHQPQIKLKDMLEYNQE